MKGDEVVENIQGLANLSLLINFGEQQRQQHELFYTDASPVANAVGDDRKAFDKALGHEAVLPEPVTMHFRLFSCEDSVCG